MATAASRTAPHKSSKSHLSSGKASAKSSARATSSRRHGTSARNGKSTRGSKTTARRSRGQQGIDSDRAREIQAALIRERYLDGEPTGVWDSRTREALSRYQGANGWQTKVTPDSRALIKLGLGPTHEGLLNPESAAVPSRVSQLGGERAMSNGAVQR
jgi:peptidoglycan hydrolase-like protein with peptidoglycan-binding domain